MKTLALVLLGLTAAALARAEDYPASEKFAQNYPVSAQAVLSLSNINGSIEIIAWDKNMIALETEKRARTAEDLPKILIKIDATTDHLTIETKHQKDGWFGRSVKGLVHYTLHVPAGIDLRKIESVNSNISISEVHGEVIASTVNGNIHITDVTAAAKLDTVNGNIEATVAQTAKERTISAQSVNGNCKLTLPADIAANLQASTVNGHIKCAFPLTPQQSSRTKLEGHVGQGLEATIEASTVNGNIAFNEQ